MKLQNKSLLIMAGLVVSTALSAGSSSGSGPPARERLSQLLRDTPSLDAGLYLESNVVKLGLNTDLAIEYTAASSRLKPQALVLTGSDISLLESQVADAPLIPLNIDAEPLGSNALAGGNKSYRVTLGDEIGSLELRDRRTIMRANVIESHPELKQIDATN